MIERAELLGPPTKADAAYVELRNQILRGTLQPGSRVDYAFLSDSFGLSITPLREALRRLEADHLVIRNAHRDVVIAPLTRDEARDLLTVREELEALGARLAAEHMTAEEIAAARDLMSQEDDVGAIHYLRSAGIPVSASGSLIVNRAFHRMMYCGSHNQVLIQYRDSISARVERYAMVSRGLRQSPYDPGPHRLLHAELLAAIEDHDAERAERLTRAHEHSDDVDFVELIFGPEVAGSS